jgi:putative ATPase
MAIEEAIAMVNETGDLPVPLHLRNAPTQLMKELGYSKGYKYAHSYEGNYVKQDYLPKELLNHSFWQSQPNPAENKMAEHLRKLRDRKE